MDVSYEKKESKVKRVDVDVIPGIYKKGGTLSE